jgi:hypothetical protein
MHARFIKGLALAFVAGCAVVFACVAHDNTTVSNSLPPTDATPPTRFVVDSGVVTLTGSDTTGTLGIGSVGASSPDAEELPDTTYEDLQPDLAGVGSTCHPLLQDCGNKALVCYPGALGLGNCTAPTGTGGELANCVQQSDCAQGYYCGNGRTASNICMILCDVVNSGCPKSLPCVQVPGFTDNTGYCLE